MASVSAVTVRCCGGGDGDAAAYSNAICSEMNSRIDGHLSGDRVSDLIPIHLHDIEGFQFILGRGLYELRLLWGAERLIRGRRRILRKGSV